MAYRPWIFVSPASRGIGFALTRRILQTTNAPVVVTARKDLDGVKNHLIQGIEHGEEKLDVLKLDVTDEDSIESAARTCSSMFPSSQGYHLHLALIVPGILHAEKTPAQISTPNVLETYSVNVLGPMLLMKHFHPFLPRRSSPVSHPKAGDKDDMLKGLSPHATFAMMSARVGSITDNHTGGWWSYRSSKAAVNQLVRTFDLFLRNKAGDRAFCLGMHPGTVKTDFTRDYWASTREDKLFSPEFSAERLVDLCNGRIGEGINGRGRCWDWDGKEVPP